MYLNSNTMKRQREPKALKSVKKAKYTPKRIYIRTSNLRVEKKVIDTIQNNVDFDQGLSGSNIFLVNGVGQGTDDTQRIGRRYTNVSIQMRYNISVNSTTATSAVARVMLVQDRQVNGALPSLTDILALSSDIAPMNLNNRDRFKVLYDQEHTVQPQGPQIEYCKMYKKIMVETTNTSTTTSAIAGIATGAIYLVCVGNGNSDTTCAQGNLFVRVRFTDQ